MISSTRAVLAKEVLDHLRDRRSLLSALVAPVLWPLSFGLLFTVMASWAGAERPLKALIHGGTHAPGLVKFLVRSGVEVVEAPEGFEQRIREGVDDLALEVGADYPEDFRAGRPARVEMVIDSTQRKAMATHKRVRLLLAEYAGQLGALRLLARGVSPSLVQPLQLEERDVSTRQQQAANLLNMIPMMLLMAAFIGGMHVAIDTTAGERERGSLEPLLLNPMPRLSLVVGKWLTAVMVSGVGLLVTLLGFVIALRHAPLEELGVKATLGAAEVTGALLAMVPLLLLTAAVQMLVSTYARSFKEAQSYLTILVLVPAIPGLILSLSPFKTQPWMYAVPSLGQQLLVSDVLRGDAWQPGLFLVAALGALVSAALCLFALTRLLGKEKVVFGR